MLHLSGTAPFPVTGADLDLWKAFESKGRSLRRVVEMVESSF